MPSLRKKQSEDDSLAGVMSESEAESSIQENTKRASLGLLDPPPSAETLHTRGREDGCTLSDESDSADASTIQDENKLPMVWMLNPSPETDSKIHALDCGDEVLTCVKELYPVDTSSIQDENERKPLGLFNSSPQVDRKRKDTVRRVTASPCSILFTLPVKEPSFVDQDESKAVATKPSKRMKSDHRFEPLVTVDNSNSNHGKSGQDAGKKCKPAVNADAENEDESSDDYKEILWRRKRAMDDDDTECDSEDDGLKMAMKESLLTYSRASSKRTTNEDDLQMVIAASLKDANATRTRKADFYDLQESSSGEESSNNESNKPKICAGASQEHEDRELTKTVEAPSTKVRTTNQEMKIHELQSSDEESSDDDQSRYRRISGRPSRNAARTHKTHTSNRSDDEDSKAASSRIRRSRSRKSTTGQSQWLTSFNAAESDESDEESSSSEDEESELRKPSSLDGHWLTSSSREAKLDHINNKVDNDIDKALQMLLYDLGFQYDIKPHQFEAIRFVAGYIASFPCEMKEKQQDTDGNSSDDSDVEDNKIQEMLQKDIFGETARAAALHKKQLMLDGRGMLLADEMGLGKTIEALAGAALRNGRTTKSSKKFKRLDTLIISPQDDVQRQWKESLIVSGVEPFRIWIVGEKVSERKKRVGGKTVRSGRFVLCTRYKLQSEMKRLLEYNTVIELKASRKKSFLFQQISPALLKKLRNQYRSEKGLETNNYINRNKKETRQDCLTRLIKESFGSKNSLTPLFETLVVDECHFLRNVLSYWGIGAALLGAQAKRTVLLSGTPYNNSFRDMAALMTFIDPKNPSSRVKFWEKLIKSPAAELASGWRKEFMLRRTKDVLGDELPPRERIIVKVSARPSELGIMEWYEAVFLKALNQLQDEIDDNDRQAQRETFEIMMATMACMRMSGIHNILSNGREATIQYSPSRRRLLHKLETKKCVLCCDPFPTQKAEKMACGDAKEEDVQQSFRSIKEIADARNDENIMEGDEDMNGRRKKAEKKDEKTDGEGKGPIVELSGDICRASGSGCCHYAHQKCIEMFIEQGCKHCPRCHDLASRLHFSNSGQTKRKVYCQDIVTSFSGCGFTASSKIEKAIDWLQNVPKDEKAIVFSFFKGSLDLIEGILFHDLGVKPIRYDGDVAKEQRTKELKRFQENKNCPVLLASVPSAGVGLNITEANHVLFLDRWFNPQIHDQAESRCHRLEQEKVVKVAYLDTSFTVDEVMKQVNCLKEANSKVVLADGTSLGNSATLNYNELAGVIGNSLKDVISARQALIADNAMNGALDSPLICNTDIENKLQEKAIARASQKIGKDEYSDDDSLSSTKSEETGKNYSASQSIGSAAGGSDGDDLLNNKRTLAKSKSKSNNMSNKLEEGDNAIDARKEVAQARKPQLGSIVVIELLSSDEEDCQCS